MNNLIMVFVILLTVRIMSVHSQVNNSVLNHSLFSSHDNEYILSNEEIEKRNLNKLLKQWALNSKKPSPVSSVAKNSCLNIQNHQNNIYTQLKINKPQYKVKKDIVIAVIDTGIDYTNPNLNSRIYRPAGWGLPKNFKGFDLVHSDFAPIDKDGHGTHVSGILVGLFPEAKILPIKFYEHEMKENLGVAIRLAVYMGANIINISGGGYGQDDYEESAINFAKSKGVLVISAAGNDGNNLDTKGDEYFPASYESDNIISVMANDENGHIASYSNFGVNHADISALGTIESYLPVSISSSCSGYMNGTSQATPIITATAAMLWASNPQLKYNQVKDTLLKQVDTSINLMAANKSQGKININRTISGKLQK